jgi:ribonuclease HI
MVKRFMEELAQAPPPPGGRHKKVTTMAKWLPPPSGTMKLNTDAAVAKTTEGGAVVVVCRDANGTFLGAFALSLSDSFSPATLEARACREALALAQDLNLTKICVASDCLEVINNIKQPYSDVYGNVIREIKETTLQFSSVCFRHESRRSNGEAHQLACCSVNKEFGRQVRLIMPPVGLSIPVNLLLPPTHITFR